MKKLLEQLQIGDLDLVKSSKGVKEILFVDTNIGIDHCLGLRKSGHKVYMYSTWQSAFPVFTDYISGDGFENIVKVDDIGEVLDRVQVVIFADIGFGAMIDLLRKNNIAVWGAGTSVEKLESDRIYMREVYSKLGIATPEAVVLKGVKNVLAYLEKNKGVHFIKLNKFRGNIETFRASGVEDAKVLFESAGFGPYADEFDFVVEGESEGVEIGCDCFFNGEKFVKPHFFTIEIKGMGNLCKWTEDSIFVSQFMDKIADWLKQQKFRGVICVEGFWDGKVYKVIDTTARFPYPDSACYPKSIVSYPDVLVGVAEGTLDRFEITKPYQCEIGIYTDNTDQWRVLDIDPEVLPNIGFRKVVLKNGKYYYVPGDNLVCTCNGQGDTMESAMEEAKKVTDGVKSYNIQATTGVIDKFKEVVKKLKELGVEF